MVSKVLFLILVGCAFALAKPIEKPNVEVIEVSQEEANEIFQEVQGKFKGIWEKMFKPNGFQEIKNIFDDVKDIFEKLANKHKQPQEPVESVETPKPTETVEPETVTPAVSVETVEPETVTPAVSVETVEPETSTPAVTVVTVEPETSTSAVAVEELPQ